MKIYQALANKAQAKSKLIALLIDPDKVQAHGKLAKTLQFAARAGVDYILVGGSLISNSVDDIILRIKQELHQPVVLFPGSVLQVSHHADAILLLSLISGRNPEFLIGNHVVAAPFLKKSGIEIMPTGYMLVQSGITTSVEYMSGTKPIPRTKNDIAVATALAANLMGQRLIYMDAGSGADLHIPFEMIRQVKKSIDIPLIVGGGLRTAEELTQACHAGADMVVVGSVAEKSPENLIALTQRVHNF